MISNDLVGKEFGKLTVISKSINKTKAGKSMWDCKCNCGNEELICVSEANLKQGYKKSCGCLRNELKEQNRLNHINEMIGKKFNRLRIVDFIRRDGDCNNDNMYSCECDCGETIECLEASLKRGHVKSCGCLKNEILTKLKKDLTGKTFGELTVLGRVENYISPKGQSLTQYLCQCSCGSKPLKIIANSLTKGVTKSCGCLNSIAEYNFEKLLASNNIAFIRQFKFENCKYKRKLPFDFAIFDTSNELLCVFELQGIQHYEIRGFGNKEKSKLILEYIQRNDKIKKDYCNNNDIKLLIVPYWEFKNFKKIIDKIKGEIINMKNNITPMLLCDMYKISHREQYPEGTETIFSTWTPRCSRKEGIDEVVAFGFQSFIKEYLIDYFNDNLFNKTKEEVVAEYTRVIKFTLGKEVVNTQHIEDLHDLGYLPIKIKAVKEGTLVPIRVPMLTVENTLPKFFWITNFLETIMSCQLWQPTTSATIAYQYKKILDKYAADTNGDLSGVQFQGHDFSMRGMGSLESAMLSGSGHLLSFSGTDTIPAIHYLQQYYNCDIEQELVGTSIPATEHSVMCTYGIENEIEAYKRLITEVYPNGFASIVSDTWNLWEVLDKIIKSLKTEIMNRDGRIVVRPDSGDPVLIVCGNPDGETEDERKGVVEILWDIFGGTITEKGFKQLDTHIGCIYGDAITAERCEEICKRLKTKGFASTNMVYGIGSYTYQYNTRDSFGFALKSTYAKVNGEERMLFKDPITDNGVKKSQRGKVAVLSKDDSIVYIDGMNEEEESNVTSNLLELVFENGKLVRDETLAEIRSKLASY